MRSATWLSGMPKRAKSSGATQASVGEPSSALTGLTAAAAMLAATKRKNKPDLLSSDVPDRACIATAPCPTATVTDNDLGTVTDTGAIQNGNFAPRSSLIQ